jgi:hypothetical protein
MEKRGLTGNEDGQMEVSYDTASTVSQARVPLTLHETVAEARYKGTSVL